MKITNTTNIPNEKIREFIKLVKPSGISNFDVTIKNYKYTGIRGVAYPYHLGSSYHRSNKPFIIVSVQKGEDGYPRKRIGRKGYLTYTLLTKDEAILHVIAHELRHLWQKVHPKGYRVWGARGKFSERDADAYALRKVREYRKTTPSIEPKFNMVEIN